MTRAELIAIGGSPLADMAEDAERAASAASRRGDHEEVAMTAILVMAQRFIDFLREDAVIEPMAAYCRLMQADTEPPLENEHYDDAGQCASIVFNALTAIHDTEDGDDD